MLDKMPGESEARSWFYVGLGVIVIYATIPVARLLREIVDAGVGREMFLYLAALLVILVGWIAWRNLRRRKMPLGAYCWLIGILILFAGYIYRLRAIPEEAIHLAEYGALSLLVYRALLHRMRDIGIYLGASLLVGTIGLIDEYIQWVVPARHFDLRDVYTNLAAAGLAQLALGLGLRPALISGWPARRSWGWLCHIAAVAVLLLAVGMQITPPRVVSYTAQFPSLHFLLDSDSMIAEYGYLYEEPDTGVFRSRFVAEDLKRLNDERGDEVAKVLDFYIRADGYIPFLRAHSVIRDPYAHEAGVHLFRRQYYFDRAREGGDKRREHYHIAYRENLILRNYFPRAIGNSKHSWSAEIEAEVKAGAAKHLDYESPVSASLITMVNARQMGVISVLLLVSLLILGYQFKRKSIQPENPI